MVDYGIQVSCEYLIFYKMIWCYLYGFGNIADFSINNTTSYPIQWIRSILYPHQGKNNLRRI